MTGSARRIERIEVLALAAALVPIAVAVARAAVQRWMPVGDAAYFTVRSRDVLTTHTPLLGAWSSGSAVVGIPVNNLGPLQLDLLAPFTKVSPYLGTAVGSAAINAASIVAVWWSARRLVGPGRVAWVMAATALFLATLGLPWLIDVRQQFAMVLPFYALLWVAAAMGSGVSRAVPVGLLLGSLILQTHFTYAFQSVVVTAAGVVGFMVATSGPGSWRVWRRTGIIGLGVLVLCWIQPVIDQLFGTGNLGDVLGPAREEQSAAGLDAGLQVVAGGVLLPPFWLPGSMGLFLQPHDGVTRWSAVAAILLWASAGLALTWYGGRVRGRVAFVTGTASLIALAAALIGATAIPVSMFGLTPQNYYWLWSVGAFSTIAIVIGVSTLPGVVRRGDALRRLGRPSFALPVLAVLVAVAVWPRYPVASVREDESEADRVGRPLRQQIADALGSGLVDDTVEVDLSRAFFGNDYPYVMLVELQRAGIEFRFPPGNRNLARFGESRCAEAGRYQRILIIGGREPSLQPGSIVVAEVVGISERELGEYLDLQHRFGDAIRDGTVDVDVDAIRAVLDPPLDELMEVLATPGSPAGGLARSLDEWRRWGYVDIPSSERAVFDRWFDLEKRSSADYQTVVVENPVPGDGASC